MLKKKKKIMLSGLYILFFKLGEAAQPSAEFIQCK